MKTVKEGHRNKGQADKIPRSATFSSKKPPIAENHTFSKLSKRKKGGN